MARIFQFDELADLVLRILVRHGMSEDNAAIVARVCVAAERDGATSHGLFRVAGYVSTLKSGWVDGRARPALSEEAAASVVRVDARNGFAQPALALARPVAIEKARATGICLIAIRDSHHFAALWPDVEMFARAGFVALAFVNSVTRVVPWGGRSPVYGTNPMALAVPRETGEPLVFDQASSAMAFGDIRLAAGAGHALPPGIGVDREGQPTTDPKSVIDGGALLPFGGHKGSAIAMMVEIMAAALTGGNFSFEVDFSAYPGAQTPRTGELVVVIDPRHTGARDFAHRIERLIGRLRESGQARLPGERRYRNRERSTAEGIRVEDRMLRELTELLSSSPPPT